MYTGITLALIFNLFVSFKFMNYFLFTMPAVILLSYPKIYGKFPRFLKNIVRLDYGIIIGQSIVLGIKGYLLHSIILFAVILLFRKIFNIYRRKKAQTACCSCPEFINGKICSGYEKQAEKIRILEEAFYKNMLPVDRRFEYD